ncbi:MAG: hypothetical protein ACRDMZ_18700 [Solirubrobacteraceae bacterium]
MLDDPDLYARYSAVVEASSREAAIGRLAEAAVEHTLAQWPPDVRRPPK